MPIVEKTGQKYFLIFSLNEKSGNVKIFSDPRIPRAFIRKSSSPHRFSDIPHIYELGW